MVRIFTPSANDKIAIRECLIYFLLRRSFGNENGILDVVEFVQGTRGLFHRFSSMIIKFLALTIQSISKAYLRHNVSTSKCMNARFPTGSAKRPML